MSNATNTAFIWTNADGYVTAVTFPGERVSVPGTLTAEVDVKDVIGVGEKWAAAEVRKSAPKTAKKADAA